MLATKVGEDMGEGRSLRKDYILRECEASLRRLKTDHIDLYQTHFDDEATPVAETMEAYAELIKAGSARDRRFQLQRPSRLKASLEASKTLGLPRYETLQPLYNLSDRLSSRSGYAALCRQEEHQRHPVLRIGRGFLTGKYRGPADADRNPARGARLKKYLDARGTAHAEGARRCGRATQCDAGPGRTRLADRPHHSADCQRHQPGAAQEIAKAPQIKLTADDLAAFDRATAS